jgi:hypothetical protein
VSGFLNKQAAAMLGISEVTLQIHRGQIMRKMAARSLSELVRMATKLGIPVHAVPHGTARPVPRPEQGGANFGGRHCNE